MREILTFSFSKRSEKDVIFPIPSTFAVQLVLARHSSTRPSEGGEIRLVGPCLQGAALGYSG